MTNTPERIGQIAYDGYFVACGGKSLISEAPLPTFGEQRDDIKKAWDAAAHAVSLECIKNFPR